jgi:hypothetical protein
MVIESPTQYVPAVFSNLPSKPLNPIVIDSRAHSALFSWSLPATRIRTPRFWIGWISQAIIWQISRTYIHL